MPTFHLAHSLMLAALLLSSTTANAMSIYDEDCLHPKYLSQPSKDAEAIVACAKAILEGDIASAHADNMNLLLSIKNEFHHPKDEGQRQMFIEACDGTFKQMVFDGTLKGAKSKVTAVCNNYGKPYWDIHN